MQKVQAYAVMSLRAVDAFLTEHAAELPDVIDTGSRRRLTTLLDTLRTHITDQDGTYLESQGQTQRHRALRAALIRDHMRPIARIARAELVRVPEFQSLRIPRGTLTAAKLCAAALGMAQSAEHYASIFIDAGMPSDFLARLANAANAMLAALDDRTGARGRRHGATIGLKQTISDGRHTVSILDSFVSTALIGQPDLLANWKSVIKVLHIPRPSTDASPALSLITTAPSDSASSVSNAA